MGTKVSRIVNIPNAGEKVEEAVLRAVKRLSQYGAEQARDKVPVATGELKSSIKALNDGFVADKDYAAFVEYGTEYQSAQPYMRPAFADVQKKADQVTQEEVKREL